MTSTHLPLSASELFSVKGRTVVLTGATGNLGRQYSYLLATNGANLILVDVDGDPLGSLRHEVTQIHRSVDHAGFCEVAVCDFRNRPESQSVMRDVLKRHEIVDVLINNAALTGKGMASGGINDVENCSEEVWDNCLEVNLTAVFWLTKMFLPNMVRQKKGVIVNVSSIYGNVGPDFSLYQETNLAPCPLPYAVSKAAILNFTRYVANQYGPQGIRCNTLSPGGVRSEVTGAEFIQKYSERTALGRMAANTDYLGAMLYLCSDASNYLTGTNLVVDGGWTAR